MGRTAAPVAGVIGEVDLRSLRVRFACYSGRNSNHQEHGGVAGRPAEECHGVNCAGVRCCRSKHKTPIENYAAAVSCVLTWKHTDSHHLHAVAQRDDEDDGS